MGKRCETPLIILLLISLLQLGFSSETAPSALTIRKTYIYHDGGVIGTLAQGTKLIVLAEDDERYKVQPINEEIQINGWVSKSDVYYPETISEARETGGISVEEQAIWNKITDSSGNLPRYSPLIDKEYNLDKKCYSFSKTWNQIWEEADNGLRATFGSISEKRLYQEQEVKLKQELTKLDNLEFHYFKEKSLEADRDYSVFTIDHKKASNPNFHGFCSIAPMFFKNDIDMDFGGGFAISPWKMWRASVFALNVFNNLVYSWGEDEEGKSEKYMVQPYGVRFKNRWEFNPKTRGEFFSLWGNEWEQKIEYASHDNPSYIKKGANTYLGFLIERDLSDSSTIGLSYIGEKEKRNEKYYETTYSNLDYDYSLEINLVELYFRHALSEKTRIEVAVQHVGEFEKQYYPEDEESSYEYKKWQLLPAVILEHDLNEKVMLELGYYGYNNRERRDYLNNLWQNSNNEDYENRLRFGVEYKYNPNVFCKFGVALDLDRDDELYDRGNFQIMVLW